MTVPDTRLTARPPRALDQRRRAALPLVVQSRRQDRGLSRSTVAEYTGLTPQAVTDIETGTELPTLEALFALADVLGTDAAELLHETRVLATKLDGCQWGSPRERTWSTALAPFFTRRPYQRPPLTVRS